MVRMLGEHLQSLWENVTQMSVSQARTAVRGTIGLIHGYLDTDTGLADELCPNVGDALDLAMRRFIEQNLQQALDVDELARQFRVSRSQVYRLFKRHEGVARYVWERRLQRSRTLLTAPWLQHLSIGAVAFEVGYSSNAHFSRAFRGRFGMTPRQMRAEVRDRSGGRDDRTTSESGQSRLIPDMVRALAANANPVPGVSLGE
jgi:AraC-like DNA-binding protein